MSACRPVSAAARMRPSSSVTVQRGRSAPRTDSRALARPELAGVGQPQQSQVVLDGDGGGPHQRERLGGGDLGSPGQVDGSEQHPGDGVVHGYRGTAPRLHDPGEVLRPADLQFAVEGQRGAGGVGACAALAPVSAGHEVHRLRLLARRPVALHPEQGAVCGGHGHHHTGLGGVLHQQPADDRQRRGQWMRGAQLLQGQRRAAAPGTVQIRVNSRGQAAQPALRDHASQWRRVEIGGVDLTGDEEFVNCAHVRCGRRGPGPAARRLRPAHPRSRSSRAAHQRWSRRVAATLVHSEGAMGKSRCGPAHRRDRRHWPWHVGVGQPVRPLAQVSRGDVQAR